MNRIGPGLVAVLTSLAAVSGIAGPAVAAAHQPRDIGVGESYLTDDGVRIALRGTDTGRDIGRHEVRLVVSDDTTRVRAWVPAGWSPVALTRIADLPSGGPGYVVEQEGGDFATWTVYVVDPEGGDRLVIAEPKGRLSPGGGFSRWKGDYVYQSSHIVHGALRTRIESMDHSQVLALYRWDVDDSGEQLVKHRIK